MKRATKIWLIAAAILVVAGSAVFCVSMSKAQWDFSAFGGAAYETNTVAIDGSFRKVSIRCSTEEVSVLPSENGKCSAVFYENKKEKHTANVTDGTLSVTVSEADKWYDRLTFFSFDTPKITLYLPQTAYDALTLAGSTGDVALAEAFTFGSIDVAVSTGDVACAASATGPIRIRTDTGDILCSGISAKTLSLTVSTGKVEVRDVICEEDVEVKVSTGKAELTNLSCKNLGSNGSTGELSLEKVIASGSLTIVRSTGDVRFKQCDAAELSVETDTGDVTGSLISEKIFIARSDTGRVDVPDTTSGGKCAVTTDTGDISLSVLPA